MYLFLYSSKEFSLAAGVALLPDADESSALQLISQHFDVTDKEETFSFRFMLAAVNGDPLYREPIEFSVCGASRHRGQTLSSSGKKHNTHLDYNWILIRVDRSYYMESCGASV